MVPRGGEAEVVHLSPSLIRFSQRSVSGVAELTEFMRAGSAVGAADVVRLTDGSLVTLDNTRVLVASQQGWNVTAVVHDAGDTISPSRAQAFLEQYGTRPSSWGEASAFAFAIKAPCLGTRIQTVRRILELE